MMWLWGSQSCKYVCANPWRRIGGLFNSLGISAGLRCCWWEYACEGSRECSEWTDNMTSWQKSQIWSWKMWAVSTLSHMFWFLGEETSSLKASLCSPGLSWIYKHCFQNVLLRYSGTEVSHNFSTNWTQGKVASLLQGFLSSEYTNVFPKYPSGRYNFLVQEHFLWNHLMGLALWKNAHLLRKSRLKVLTIITS